MKNVRGSPALLVLSAAVFQGLVMLAMRASPARVPFADGRVATPDGARPLHGAYVPENAEVGCTQERTCDCHFSVLKLTATAEKFDVSLTAEYGYETPKGKFASVLGDLDMDVDFVASYKPSSGDPMTFPGTILIHCSEDTHKKLSACNPEGMSGEKAPPPPPSAKGTMFLSCSDVVNKAQDAVKDREATKTVGNTKFVYVEGSLRLKKPGTYQVHTGFFYTCPEDAEGNPEQESRGINPQRSFSLPYDKDGKGGPAGL
jgi:hypothetical protein